MKRYIQLFEGKKQANQILLKIYGDKTKEIVNQLEKIDPTKNNKYIELLAKFLKQKVKLNDLKKLTSLITKAESKGFKIDISKTKSFEEFKNILEQESTKITKSSAKKGIEGLTKDKDYIEIPIKDKEDEIYIPLNYKASKIIASNRVGQCEGKWCTAYQKTDEYWIEYIKENEGILTYVIRNNDKLFKINQKQAIYFHKNKKDIERFDANDNKINSVSYEKEIKNYVYKNWDKIKSKLPKSKHWIHKATIKDAEFKISNDNIYWEYGVWEHGVWEDGIWKNGTWNGGIWKDGEWKNGEWIGGEWIDGEWIDGTWKDGLWRNGIWKNGIWKDGIWGKGIWKKGVWSKGLIHSSKFNRSIESFINPKEFKEREKVAKSLEELKKLVLKENSNLRYKRKFT